MYYWFAGLEKNILYSPWDFPSDFPQFHFWQRVLTSNVRCWNNEGRCECDQPKAEATNTCRGLNYSACLSIPTKSNLSLVAIVYVTTRGWLIRQEIQQAQLSRQKREKIPTIVIMIIVMMMMMMMMMIIDEVFPTIETINSLDSFKSFEKVTIRILFFCGKNLDLRLEESLAKSDQKITCEGLT